MFDFKIVQKMSYKKNHLIHEALNIDFNLYQIYISNFSSNLISKNFLGSFDRADIFSFILHTQAGSFEVFELFFRKQKHSFFYSRYECIDFRKKCLDLNKNKIHFVSVQVMPDSCIKYAAIDTFEEFKDTFTDIFNDIDIFFSHYEEDYLNFAFQGSVVWEHGLYNTNYLNKNNIYRVKKYLEKHKISPTRLWEKIELQKNIQEF